MTIAYYVSGHGFGHASRSVAIQRLLPPEIPLWISTAAPGWFFQEEVSRPFQLRPRAFDCGAIQTDALTVDQAVTLGTYARIADANAKTKDDEVRWLREIGARLVVADAPSFPLAVAREAGIPAACVANFTWVDIYRPYLAEFPRYAAMVDAIEAEYRQADVAFIPQLNLPMPFFSRRREVPIISRPGRVRRGEIARACGVDPARRWVLFYPGHFPLDQDWAALDTLPDTTVFVFVPPPEGLKNVVDMRGTGRGFPHADTLVSMDAVAAKPGYGIVSDCMAAGVPMLYTSREHFAEYEALDRALTEWGGASRLTPEDFTGGRWSAGLDALQRLKPVRRMPSTGAEIIAEALAGMAR